MSIASDIDDNRFKSVNQIYKHDKPLKRDFDQYHNKLTNSSSCNGCIMINVNVRAK